MPPLSLQRLPLYLVLSLSLAACQATVQHPAVEQARTISESLPSSCTAQAQSFRDDVGNSGTTNASAPALAIFPLLHSNRFFHALSRTVDSEAQSIEWTALLAELAIRVRASENGNLSSPWGDEALDDLAECSRIFSTSPEYREERLAALDLVSRSEFPSNYSRGRQMLGALPLLRPFLKQRILAEHDSERRMYFEDETFARSSLYRPEDDRHGEVEVAAWMRAAYENNSLQLPLLSEAQLATLFRNHSPELQIELLDANDRIGAPRWEGGRVKIDSESAIVYTLPSMTSFEGRNLLQLNYVFWFPERKPGALIDLYAGAVDGIIWRVTLDEEGQVLLYDSIHSCGCYHKYFAASEKLVAKTPPTSREPANIFRLDRNLPRNGLVLKMTGNEHFIVGIEAASAGVEAGGELERYSYNLSPYSLLENLESAGGSRSLFDARGLISGSERLERFTLWPTGIHSVGAMRQWGTHATGFIQDQHFDDSSLFEDYFETQH